MTTTVMTTVTTQGDGRQGRSRIGRERRIFQGKGNGGGPVQDAMQPRGCQKDGVPDCRSTGIKKRKGMTGGERGEREERGKREERGRRLREKDNKRNRNGEKNEKQGRKKEKWSMRWNQASS